MGMRWGLARWGGWPDGGGWLDGVGWKNGGEMG